MIFEGGCLCGAVRWRAMADPTWVGHCHCTMCRRASGAAAVSWAAFPEPSFTITKGTPARYVSSSRAARQFCATCGGQLTFQFNKDIGKTIDVTIGSFDDPAALRPKEHVFTKSRIAWLKLDEHLPERAAPMPDAT